MIDKHLLPRVSDRISFLYIEDAKLVKKDSQIMIITKNGEYALPYGTMLAILLGPGTSITHDVLDLIGVSGSTINFVGKDCLRFYAYGQPLNSSSKLIYQQARYATNKRLHLEVARKMYQKRFPDENFTGLSVAKMRGKEGARMKQIYQMNAEKFGVAWHGRHYEPNEYEQADLINQLLTSANQMLYAICLAVINALGFSPALGFIHVGLSQSFVYDLSDLYKAEITIPVAFATAKQDNPYKALKVNMRNKIQETGLIKQMVNDLFDLFNIEQADLIEVLYLWDNIKTLQKSNIQYKERR